MLALAAAGRDRLDLKQALGHDKVNRARIDEVSTKTGCDLAERLDE